MNILKPLCEQKGLVIHASAAPDVPIIHTDAAKLQQVLYNFLSNAIKFSPAGARIDLAATRATDGRQMPFQPRVSSVFDGSVSSSSLRAIRWSSGALTDSTQLSTPSA